MSITKSFRDLIVWQKSRDLAVIIYNITSQFPRSELYGLSSQMQRAVISISSNIAESYHRFHQKEKRQFLAIAFGSGSELESQIEISKILFPKIDYKGSENC
ncbi:MAG: four helix bundle protein [Patescibacteria group bacterium]